MLARSEEYVINSKVDLNRDENLDRRPDSKTELSSIGDDQWVDDLTAVDATENEERSLLRVNHFFIH